MKEIFRIANCITNGARARRRERESTAEWCVCVFVTKYILQISLVSDKNSLYFLNEDLIVS